MRDLGTPVLISKTKTKGKKGTKAQTYHKIKQTEPDGPQTAGGTKQSWGLYPCYVCPVGRVNPKSQSPCSRKVASGRCPLGEESSQNTVPSHHILSSLLVKGGGPEPPGTSSQQDPTGQLHHSPCEVHTPRTYVNNLINFLFHITTKHVPLPLLAKSASFPVSSVS